MPASQVGFGVLGPLEMTVGGVRVSLGSRKQRAVLAMLLINRNRVVGSDALIERGDKVRQVALAFCQGQTAGRERDAGHRVAP